MLVLRLLHACVLSRGDRRNEKYMDKISDGGNFPQRKNLKRYKKRKPVTYAPGATSIQIVDTMQSRGAPESCPWCKINKHNTAVRIIIKAIANGDRGADSIVYNDGGNAAKWARSGAAHLHKTVGNIPADLLFKAQLKAAGSRPDIVLYQRKSVKRTPEGLWITSQAQIMLLEVKYTRDTDPSRTHQDPYQQHESLYQILQQRHPSAIIERKPIILGVAGAVCAEATVRQLESLGMKGNLLQSCVHKLQRHAI